MLSVWGLMWTLLLTRENIYHHVPEWGLIRILLLTWQNKLLWCPNRVWVDIIGLDHALNYYIYDSVTEWAWLVIIDHIGALNWHFILIIPEWGVWNDITNVLYVYSFWLYPSEGWYHE